MSVFSCDAGLNDAIRKASRKSADTKAFSRRSPLTREAVIRLLIGAEGGSLDKILHDAKIQVSASAVSQRRTQINPAVFREAFENFDIAEYTKKRFGMYDGDVTKVKLLVDNSYAGVIIDRFGKDVPMLKADENHFFATVAVAVSNQFLGWVISMSDFMRVVGPDDVVDRLKVLTEKLYNQYRSENFFWYFQRGILFSGNFREFF